MTPKEKAIELYSKFNAPFFDKGKTPNISQLMIIQSFAKECSLIAVDEIIASIPTQPNQNNKLEKTNAIMYWVEVKNELLKQKTND